MLDVLRHLPGRLIGAVHRFLCDTPGTLQEAFEIVPQKSALKGGEILQGAAVQEAVEPVEVLLDV